MVYQGNKKSNDFKRVSVLLVINIRKSKSFYQHKLQMINFSINKTQSETIEQRVIRTKWEFEKQKQSDHLIFPTKFAAFLVKGSKLIYRAL